MKRVHDEAIFEVTLPTSVLDTRQRTEYRLDADGMACDDRTGIRPPSASQTCT
jgi:hypothetical protein